MKTTRYFDDSNHLVLGEILSTNLSNWGGEERRKTHITAPWVNSCDVIHFLLAWRFMGTNIFALFSGTLCCLLLVAYNSEFTEYTIKHINQFGTSTTKV